MWREERDKVEQSAATIAERLRSLRSQGGREPVPAAAVLERAAEEFAVAFDRRRGGFGECAEVSAAERAAVPAARARADRRQRTARHGARDAARDGAGRHARPHRRRIPSLLGGRRLARAALREDALRPGAAGARLRRGGAAHRRRLLRRRRRRHARLRAPRPHR